jgi:hypothetical protein
MTDQPQDDRIVDSLSRAARGLRHRRSLDDLEHTFNGIIVAAVQTVPGADAGGVTMTENSRITSRHPTENDVHVLDDLQAQLREGPCVDAATRGANGNIIYTPDLGSADATEAWPRFAPAAVERGFRSLLSVPMAVQPGRRAALNLYSHGVDAFDGPAVTLARLFALQAAVLLYGSEQTIHLRAALESRDTIGQAKGVLQERFDVDDEVAFQLLVQSSQDTNMKLAEVAQWLLDNRRTTRPATGTTGG